MSTNNILFKDLSDKIIDIAFKVHTKLGCSLPEHCYERSLIIEFNKQYIPCVHQKRYDVFYDDEQVGHFFTDIVVDNKIILELKSHEAITSNHYAQLFTYLRTTKLHVGYILNFGSKCLLFKRLVI